MNIRARDLRAGPDHPDSNGNPHALYTARAPRAALDGLRLAIAIRSQRYSPIIDH